MAKGRGAARWLATRDGCLGRTRLEALRCWLDAYLAADHAQQSLPHRSRPGWDRHEAICCRHWRAWPRRPWLIAPAARLREIVSSRSRTFASAFQVPFPHSRTDEYFSASPRLTHPPKSRRSVNFSTNETLGPLSCSPTQASATFCLCRRALLDGYRFGSACTTSPPTRPLPERPDDIEPFAAQHAREEGPRTGHPLPSPNLARPLFPLVLSVGRRQAEPACSSLPMTGDRAAGGQQGRAGSSLTT
jgi:hypothetical protein